MSALGVHTTDLFVPLLNSVHPAARFEALGVGSEHPRNKLPIWLQR